MVTSFSVAKESVEDIEYMKEYCFKNGLSKSFLIMKLIKEWVKKEKRKCTTSTH